MTIIFQGIVQQKTLGEREALSVCDPPTVESCQIVDPPTSNIASIFQSMLKIFYRCIMILVLDLFQGKRTEDVSTRRDRPKCCVGLVQNGGGSSFQDDQMGAHWEGGLGRSNSHSCVVYIQLLSIKENICAERHRKSYALPDAKK